MPLVTFIRPEKIILFRDAFDVRFVVFSEENRDGNTDVSGANHPGQCLSADSEDARQLLCPNPQCLKETRRTMAEMHREEHHRDDVKHLARVVPFDLDILKSRYHNELRIYLGIPEREDLTLKLWIEMIEESQNHES